MVETAIIEKYNQELEKYGPNDRRSMFWTKDKQDMRFDLLLGKEFKKSNLSLLDYGCGFCDLKSFLIRNFYHLKYNGCDINKKFIAIGCEKYQDNIFVVKSANDLSMTYDIIVVSGTFNLLTICDAVQMKNYVFEQILKLFEKTNYMLSINFLSHLTDQEYKYEGHFYLNPMDLYAFAIEHMTKRIEINAASLPYEVTMKFYKNEAIHKELTVYDS